MSDNDLIRRGDALALFKSYALLAQGSWIAPIMRGKADAIAALPAVTVGVRPLDWQLVAAKDGAHYRAFDPLYGRDVEAPDEATFDAIDQTRAARILAALEPQPTHDAHEVREVARAHRDGWRFAYRQWQATGSVPNPDYTVGPDLLTPKGGA